MIHASAECCRIGARACVRPHGFSLTELLISIAILGIGMTMIAALFTTGLLQAGMSLGATKGSIAAANGLAVAKLRLTAKDIPGNDLGSFSVIVDGDHTLLISKQKQLSPYDPYYDPDHSDYNPKLFSSHVQYDPSNPKNREIPLRGFVILGRKCEGDSYQLVSVAYDKSSPNGKVVATTVFSSKKQDKEELWFRPTTYLKVGSPVIIASGDRAGEYATIVSTRTNYATFDRKFSMKANQAAYVVVEKRGNLVLDESPVIGVRMVKTSLK